jgi:hypothetical protein
MVLVSDKGGAPASPNAPLLVDDGVEAVVVVVDEDDEDIIPRRVQNNSNPRNALGTILQKRK